MPPDISCHHLKAFPVHRTTRQRPSLRSPGLAAGGPLSGPLARPGRQPLRLGPQRGAPPHPSADGTGPASTACPPAPRLLGFTSSSPSTPQGALQAEPHPGSAEPCGFSTHAYGPLNRRDNASGRGAGDVGPPPSGGTLPSHQRHRYRVPQGSQTQRRVLSHGASRVRLKANTFVYVFRATKPLESLTIVAILLQTDTLNSALLPFCYKLTH